MVNGPEFSNQQSHAYEVSPELILAQADFQLQLQAEREILRQAATIDGLTGALTRAGMNAEWPGLVGQAQRDNKNMSLLAIDLDDFKDVNDNGGHAAGDEVLKDIATIFLGGVRVNDKVVRLGGDEFVIILSGADTENAEIVAEKIRQAVAAHGKVTASIGVSAVDFGKSLEENLAPADDASYKAKAQGRNQVRVHGRI